MYTILVAAINKMREDYSKVGEGQTTKSGQRTFDFAKNTPMQVLVLPSSQWQAEDGGKVAGDSTPRAAEPRQATSPPSGAHCRPLVIWTAGTPEAKYATSPPSGANCRPLADKTNKLKRGRRRDGEGSGRIRESMA
jgi:hypothetical protein